MGLDARAQDAPTVPKTDMSRVVLVRHADAVDAEGKPNGEVLAQMLDDAVVALFDVEESMTAFKQLFKPGDIVGIKTNVWRFLRTPVALEEALKMRVAEAGVAVEKIAIDDRGVRGNPIFQNATALVNARPMRTHHWSGVGSLIKNYIMFDEKPYTWHKDGCADLAGVWELPAVKGKTRLCVLVMLTPLFHGKGPHHFQASYTWPYKGLIVGTDPVAVDATGLRILVAKRRAHFGEDQPFAVSPKHIQVAQDKFRLGNADPDRIELKTLGWKGDLLLG
ncbi:MAG TPA: DUF362 domain-containing protein [Candidatus Hydrogenedentes bacterium]|nr:DUF362 domain-containing protein [Candidatus Hydrogenedentota bacterium]